MSELQHAGEQLADAARPSPNATRRKRFLLFGLALAPLVVLSALLGFATFGKGSGVGGVAVERNRVAPDFTLPSFAGGEISLANYSGKPVFLYFWASWCIPCREEAPMLEAMWREYEPRGLVFLGVNIQDREEDAIAFLREFNTTFPNVRDTDGRVYIDYGVYGVPEIFFIRRDGTIASSWIGGIKEEQLRPLLDDLLAE